MTQTDRTMFLFAVWFCLLLPQMFVFIKDLSRKWLFRLVSVTWLVLWFILAYIFGDMKTFQIVSLKDEIIWCFLGWLFLVWMSYVSWSRKRPFLGILGTSVYWIIVWYLY